MYTELATLRKFYVFLALITKKTKRMRVCVCNVSFKLSTYNVNALPHTQIQKAVTHVQKYYRDSLYSPLLQKTKNY